MAVCYAICLALACGETGRSAAAPSAAASAPALQDGLSATTPSVDVPPARINGASQGGVLDVSDPGHVLTAGGVTHLRHVVGRVPFKVRLALIDDYPSIEGLERYARSLVNGPNLIVIGVDPTHHHVEVRFGIESHVPREAWKLIERSGNPAFRRGDFEGGVTEIILAAVRAIEPSGNDSSSDRGASSMTPDAECAKPCTGSASVELTQRLAIQAADVRGCYNAALVADPTLKGALVVHLRIASDGSQCESDIKQSDMPSAMNRCVLDDFRNFNGPGPRGGCVDAEVPIRFGPHTDDGGAPGLPGATSM